MGGHIGSDGDGLGPKQPELFDIHVMIFAGDPESTADGLARFFSIDRDAAQRLVEEVPIVVKRSAEPDVAAEMVDVLGGLGAQVVLLPAASAVSPETDLLELKVPSIVPSPPAAAASQEWGGLATVERPRAGEPREERPRHAATVDLIASAPMAELDLSQPAAPTVLEARAPARSAPPVRRGVIDDELVIEPLYDPGEAAGRVHPHAGGVSLPPAVSESIPPALGGPVGSSPLAAPSVPSLPDLGLGSVPPLPQLGAMGPPPPPPVPAAALRGAPRVPPPSPKPPRPAARPQPPPAPGPFRSHYERTLEGEDAAKLPSLGVVAPLVDKKAAARPAGADGYWAGRRAAAPGGAAELGEVDGPVAPRPAAGVHDAMGGAPGEALRAAPPRPSPRSAESHDEPPRARSLGRAMLQIAAGAAVFAFFAQQDNSILLGNADLIAIIVHGFALFAIGLGLVELRP